MASIQELEKYVTNPNVRQFLDVISQAEGTDKNGYNTAFGGGFIQDLTDHPRKLHSFTQTDGKSNKTSAAGRYQFIQPTWDGLAKQYGFKDFSPESQDLAAVALLKQNGALQDIIDGRMKEAIAKSGRTWASLPSSPYAQPKRDQGFIERAFNAVIPAAAAGELPSNSIDPSKITWDEPIPSAPVEIDASKVQWDDAAPTAAQVQADPREIPYVPSPGAEIPQGAKTKVTADDGGVLAGVIQGFCDPIDAGAQMMSRALDNTMIGRGINSLGNALAEYGLVAPTSSSKDVDRLVNESNARYEEGRKLAGREGFDIARLGGNIVGTAPTMAIPGGQASLMGRVLAGAGQGAALGALNPVVGEQAQQNFGDEKLGQIGMGAAFGGATPVVTGAIGRLISPNASRADSAAQLLAREGVELTPGQALGGTLMRMEDRAMSVPIVGDAIRAARTRGNDSLNRAVYNRVLEPIGKSTAKGGREAVDDAARLVSQAYDDVLGKVRFTPDNAFAQNIANLQNMASNLPAREAQAFNNALQREVLEPLSKGVSIDGQTFKRIEAQLGDRANSFLKATDAYQNDVGRALLEAQKMLRDNLARMNPSHADELANVNKSFAQLVRLETAAGKIGAQDGAFTPQQLAQAIRQSDRSVRKNAYSRGNALMQDLSDAAQSRMSAKIPDSGTAERLMLGGGALASGAFSPAIPAGLAAASIPYLPGVSRAATGAFTKRPASAQALADQLKNLPPGFLGILPGAR